MKEPLKVGDRVKVYGGAPGGTSGLYFSGAVGEVLKIGNDIHKAITVKIFDGQDYWFFPQQLRRINCEFWVRSACNTTPLSLKGAQAFIARHLALRNNGD